MGSPRQPLGASTNRNGPVPPSSSPQHTAALSGATRAFIKAIPRDEAPRYIKASPKDEAPRYIAKKEKPLPPKSPKPALGHASHPPSSRGRRDGSEAGAGKLAAPHALAVPKRPRHKPTDSSSSIAAILAAGRASPSVHAKTHSPPDDVSVRSDSRASVRAAENVYPPSKRTSPDKLDQTPIAPTTSLVELFERNASPPPPVTSPKPVRNLDVLRNQTLDPITTRLADLKHDDSSSDESFTSARDHLSPDRPMKPDLPPARRSTQRIDSKLDVPTEPRIHVQPPSRNVSANDLKPPSAPAARSVSRARPTTRSPMPRNASASKSLSVSRSRSPNPLTHPEHRSITAAFHQLYPRRMTPLKSGDSLANAIVASSLASSRAPSPAKMAPPPTNRRPSSSSFFSRTPSPTKKGMRHTMRKASSSSFDEEDEDPYGKHKKKRLIKKHPNKHHEGDRKRWRDAVTQRERRRYEGVWAANKGIWVSFTPAEQKLLAAHPDSAEADTIRTRIGDQVSDLVVKDIWSRSRLPDHELQQVWDLVDHQRIGRLQREEFVVGLWLVDQRLKGRKLPVKVSESVWSSVRLVSGIKLRQK